MKKFVVGVLVLLPLLLVVQLVTLVPVVWADEISPPDAIVRLFTAPNLKPEWFAPPFLRQIPLPVVEQIVTNIEETVGEYQSIQPGKTDDAYQVLFAEGKIPTQIQLNPAGQITFLFFQPPVANALDLDMAIAQLRELPGRTSLWVEQAGEPLANFNGDRLYAIGSTFKLAVLQTLKQEIEADQRSWQDVVELQPDWKSLPSGVLQTWPDNSPITLQTLATLMISQSDNTATDVLIQVLGREAIEPQAGRNIPLLTTREAFILKNPQNRDLLLQYQKGDGDDRRQMLPTLNQAALPDAALFNGSPVEPDVEWFFSGQELCQAMAAVEDLPFMTINPGVVDSADWQRVAFKGGSEPGILNLTSWLEAQDGNAYCVSATWNDKEVALDEVSFSTLYGSIVEGLKSSSE